MRRPRILDLYCGAGGASVGFWRAGLAPEGVDVIDQPRFPFRFRQADALAVLADRAYLRRFDAIHASPPCQEHSILQSDADTGWMLTATLELLRRQRLPWVVENVATAPLATAPTLFGAQGVMLCGSMFGLGTLDPPRQLRRHRLFESSFPIPQPQCAHRGYAIGVYGQGSWNNNNWAGRPENKPHRGGNQGNAAENAEAMGVDWMTRDAIAQAVPPAYTEHIGAALLAHLDATIIRRRIPVAGTAGKLR